MRHVAMVTTAVLVEVADGVERDEATLRLAAETAARNGEAHSEHIDARVLSRDCRFVAQDKKAET